MDQTPDSFPLTLDVAADAVRVVQLAESDYRSASFLDERLLAVTGQGTWLEWPSFAAQAPAGTALGADFIFHMGHVGSTLAARLLGGHPRVFALREPAVLRVFAQMELDLDRPESLWSSADWERRLALFMRLYARVWRPQQRALVKATSQVSEIAPRLMDQAPGARAFLMYVAPEPYLATILAGAASRVELRANAPSRLRRLHRRLGRSAWRVADAGPGVLAAMAWASEAWSLVDAWRAFGERAAWIDFDAFLQRPRPHLAAMLRHLHGEAAEDDVEAMMASGELGRYAKATEHAYDADLRRDVLDQARREHGQQIAEGLTWINAAGAAEPKLADAIRSLAGAARLA